MSKDPPAGCSAGPVGDDCKLIIRPHEAMPYILLVCLLYFFLLTPRLMYRDWLNGRSLFLSCRWGPPAELQKNLQKFPTHPLFLQGGKKSQILRPHVFCALPLLMEDFFRNLKKLSRSDGGHTSWYQLGEGGSSNSRSFATNRPQNEPQRGNDQIAITRAPIV